MRIVIVEDEANTREGLVKLLHKLDSDYDVVGEAENGHDGFLLIERLRPDLVITDIKMPLLSGIDMLSKLKDLGHRHKTIVLTGFSEFEYAKKALQLGVVDFLEKPITVGDLTDALHKIDQELAYQQLVGLPNTTTAEQTEQLILRTLSREDVDPSLLSYHLQQTGFQPEQPFYLIQWYAGCAFKETLQFIKEVMPGHIAPLGHHLLFPLPSDLSVNLLLQNFEGKQISEAELDQVLVCLQTHLDLHVVASRLILLNLSKLRDDIRRLIEIRKWSISLNQLPVLTEDAVAGITTKPFHYPVQIENRIDAAITESKSEDVKNGFSEWLSYCLDGSYVPKQVIDATIHFVTSILKAVANHHGDEAAYQKQDNWLDPIRKAQTKWELIEAVQRISEETSRFRNEYSYSYVVNKTLHLIHRHYHEGINLDEIASLLHITPEYLSSIFAREVKKNYSSYVKDIRINKAKELLLRSDMKTFEIAQNVGYPDAKYFSRVFKEVTGLTPGEYQRKEKQP